MREYIITDEFIDDLAKKFASAQGQLKELIRCKDCKHWDGYFCHNKWWGNGYGNYAPPIKKKEGFCDWAERKEE